MADRPDPAAEPDDAHLGAIARHALHDEELIAAFAAGDLEEGAEQDRARSMVERCAPCRELHADLTLIGAELRSMPDAAALAATLSAPRDYRLAPEKAISVRPAAPLPRLATRIAAALATFGRPVGATLATFGLVGILIGSTGATMFSAGSGQTPTVGEVSATGAPGGPIDGFPVPQATDTDGRNLSEAPKATDLEIVVDNTRGDEGAGPEAGRVLLLGGSLVALAIGLGILAFGEASRRRRRAA